MNTIRLEYFVFCVIHIYEYETWIILLCSLTWRFSNVSPISFSPSARFIGVVGAVAAVTIAILQF